MGPPLVKSAKRLSRAREMVRADNAARPSGDVSPDCPTSGSLPAISFKLTLLVEGPPWFRDRLRFPHLQPSLSPSSLSHENYSLVCFPSDGKSNLLTDLVLHPCTKKRLFKSVFAFGRISNINIRVSILYSFLGCNKKINAVSTKFS